MADEKLKEEQQVELVEKSASPDDFESVDAQSLEQDINVDDDDDDDDDASLHAGKVSFAQKVVGDRFKVLDIIGQGGMGSVYKVRDLQTDRVVALKLLKPELCEDKAVLKRFQQEAASLAELDHENIVTVYDHGITSDGAPFLIMQFLDGETLADYLIRNGKLSPTQAIGLTLQICRGLDYAHRRGFVHRDIKPSNIVLLNDGTGFTVKLLDFGIAKIVESKSAATTSLTQTGDVFGTPAYMSPEQCQGGEIDNRTDIYSLGCVLYEMLTAKQPFAGTNAIQVALKHINGTPDSFTKKVPDGDVLHSLEEIVFKCMKKNSHERFESVAELSEDLEVVKSGRAVGYADSSDDSPQAKTVWTKIWSVTSHVSNFFLFWIVLTVYACTVTILYSADPSQTDHNRSSVTFALLGTAIFGLLIHAKAAARAISQARKRKPLLEWMTALLAVLIFSLYALIAIIATTPKSSLGGDFLTLSVLACSTMLWALVGSSIILGASLRVKNLLLNFYHWTLTKRNPAHVRTKSSRSPMSFGKASCRIAAIAAVVVGAYITAFPAETSSFLSTGVFNLVRITGADIAVPVLETSIALDKKNANAYRALAYYYSDLEDEKQALKALNTGLAIAPGDPELLRARGEEYLARGQYNEAIADFEKKAGDDPKVRIALGQAYLGTNELDKAYRTFTQAINDSGHSFGSLEEAYSGRGMSAYAQGRYQSAVDDFSRALEEGIYTDKPLNYLRRGLAYQALGQRMSARHDFETAFRDRGESDGETSLAKAFCFIQRNDPASASIAMRAATEAGLTKDDLKNRVFPHVQNVRIDW